MPSDTSQMTHVYRLKIARNYQEIQRYRDRLEIIKKFKDIATDIETISQPTL